MPKDILQQVNHLYDLLVGELDHYKKGQIFLSTRTIMNKYNASRRTVEKVLDRLKDEKQIVIEAAYGIFVNRERNNKIKHVVSVHADWPSEYWHALDLEIEKQLDKRERYKFSRILYNPDSYQDYLQFINERMGDVIILPHPIGMNNIAELGQVLNANIPVIFLADNLFCAGINAVSTQPEYTGMLAADFLLRKGHTRLALIISEPWNPGEQRISNGFCNMLKIRGITPEIIDCKIVRGDASRSKTHDVFLSYLRKNKSKVTGCFALSDYSAFGVIDAINDLGLSVPGDLSVIGCFGSVSGANFHPPLTTVAHNLQQIAAVVGDGLDDLFAGKKFGIRTVSASIIERQSVKDLNIIR